MFQKGFLPGLGCWTKWFSKFLSAKCLFVGVLWYELGIHLLFYEKNLVKSHLVEQSEPEAISPPWSRQPVAVLGGQCAD